MFRGAWLAIVLLSAILVSACATGRSLPATDVADSSAALNGDVSSIAKGTVSYWFAYGRTAAYGNETPRRTLTINDRLAHPVSEPISGLERETIHHYRVCARFMGATPSCGADRTFTTAAAPQPEPTELSITAQPALYPQFDPAISDYVTRCTSDPVVFEVAAPEGTAVAVDGQPGRSGRFSRLVRLRAGQRFDFSTAAAGDTQTYHVRCLPSDFPDWTFSRSAEPSQDWTLLGLSKGNARFVVFFDRAGVPVWWYRTSSGPTDAKLLSDNTFAFAAGGGGPFGFTPDTAYEIRRLDGTLIRTLKTVDTPTDHHDLQQLANGNYLILSYRPRYNVDLSAYGGSSDSTVRDAEIQELTPEGSLQWSWNSKDHIALSETTWLSQLVGSQGDGVHINAVEPDGDSLLISLRHTDAVYRISRSDGHVEWKLGGTTTPESLTVSGDGYPATFSGQHDARRLADGTVSVYDNATLPALSRPPRAVRFRIDPDAKTAALVESVGDPEISSSNCCGSARKLDSAGWLIGWGTSSSPTIAEYAAGGSRVFKLHFNGAFSYRAFPVPRGRIDAATLREAMDEMSPR